jgi:hypothetical protein
VSDDDYWRRPSGVEEPPRSFEPPPASEYAGPPRSAPPPTGWQPQKVLRPAPPRPMPKQDVERIEREEQAATILTKGLGIFAAAVLVVLLLVFCGRVLF